MNRTSVQLDHSLRWMAPIEIPDLIRMGSDYDGGYVLSERVLPASQGMLSLGVGDNWTFDQEWRDRKPTDVIHSYDGTISVDRMSPEKQQSYRHCFQGLTKHYTENAGKTTKPGVVSFPDMLDRMDVDQIFLKMDVEGAEFHLADDIYNNAHRVTGITGEYHYTCKFREMFLDQMRRFNEKFYIIHVHYNNGAVLCDDNLPNVLEFTLLRRDLYDGPVVQRFNSYLPELDQPNDPNQPDLEIHF